MAAEAPPPQEEEEEEECGCLFCATGFEHRQFVLAVVDKRLLSACADVTIYWDYSRQPFYRMRQHNRDPRVKPGPADTKGAAGHNLLLFQLGPFHANAYAFVSAMRQRRINKQDAGAQIRCALMLAGRWSESVDSQQTDTLQAFVDDEHTDKLVRLAQVTSSRSQHDVDETNMNLALHRAKHAQTPFLPVTHIE